VLASGIFVNDVLGYNYWTHALKPYVWPGKEIIFKGDRRTFPAGSKYRTAFERAIQKWNQAPGDFHFDVEWDQNNTREDNGKSEVWFSRKLDDDVLAVRYPQYNRHIATPGYSGPALTEADIVFNSNKLWSTDRIQSTKVAYGGDYNTFGTTALHEMGHALGLDHENEVLNIMGMSQLNLHANRRRIRTYVGEDASNGEVFLYGLDATSSNDASVSHWKYWKAGGSDYDGDGEGDYSVNRLTAIYDSILGGPPVSGISFEGVKLYYVKKGFSYDVQFTYENNGYDDLSKVDIGYYISTNRIISTRDRQLASRIMDLSRDIPSTEKYTLTIPSYVIEGQTYWLGVIVDCNDGIPEFDEKNNAAYIPIKIVP
jgi:hypothetical protein